MMTEVFCLTGSDKKIVCVCVKGVRRSGISLKRINFKGKKHGLYG